MFNVSAIITTFKRNNEFFKALNSVYLQKYQPQEIIIVNNDNNFFYNIKNNKKKITIVNCIKNFNSANGRNLGASLAKGNFLAFLDDDDLWDKNYLKDAYTIYKNVKAPVIISDIYNFNHKDKIFRSMNKIKKLNIQDCFISNPGFIGSNIIIQKKIFADLDGFDNNLIPAEDRGLLVNIILKKTKISYSPGKIYYKYSKKRLNLSNNFFFISVGHRNFLYKYKNYITFAQKNYILFKVNIAKFKTTYGITKIIYLIYSIFFLIIFKILNKKIFFRVSKNS